MERVLIRLLLPNELESAEVVQNKRGPSCGADLVKAYKITHITSIPLLRFVVFCFSLRICACYISLIILFKYTGNHVFRNPENRFYPTDH